jgi:hypothetical protein
VETPYAENHIETYLCKVLTVVSAERSQGTAPRHGMRDDIIPTAAQRRLVTLLAHPTITSHHPA